MKKRISKKYFNIPLLRNLGADSKLITNFYSPHENLIIQKYIRDDNFSNSVFLFLRDTLSLMQ
jgi:hypothetical protein